MPKTLLIDARSATTLGELYPLLATQWPGRRLHNLDALADLLRESQITALVLANCRLYIPDYQALTDMCQDLGIRLSTHP